MINVTAEFPFLVCFSPSRVKNHIPTAHTVLDKFLLLHKYVMNNMGIGYQNQNQGENYYVCKK